MSGGAWARVSLRIESGRRSAQEIVQLMGRQSDAAPDKAWAADIAGETSVSLNDQMSLVKNFLEEKAEILEGLKDCEININISWTPRVPQDGIVLDVELVALLSRLRCYVLLDTYSD